MKNFAPHDYQTDLFETAIKQNTIVALGTGTGKTFIAILLIKEFSYQYLELGKKAIFVANTIPLVEQQYTQITKHCDLTVEKLHGGSNKDLYTDGTIFKQLFAKAHVLVLTAEVLLNLLRHGMMSLSAMGLLIFDECHHCIGKKHPYRQICEAVKNHENRENIRILGLTGSAISNRIPLSRLEMAIDQMEQIMGARLETASDITSIAKHAVKPKQLLVKCVDDTNTEFTVLTTLNRLQSFIENSKDFVSELEIDPRRPIQEAIARTKNVLQRIGSWCALKSCILWQKKLAKLSEDKLLGDKQKLILRTAETSFRLCSKMLSKKVSHINSLDQLLPTLSDRMRKLLELLSAYNPNTRKSLGIEENLACLIFVEQRFVAYMLNILLKSLAKWEPDFAFIKADFIVGHSGTLTETDDTKVANKKQEQTLQKFRNGALNVLVVTTVLEEGIDIKNCNSVIRFDPPSDFRSYVQSRGRARKENGTYVIFSEEKQYAKLAFDLSNYAHIEEFLLRRTKAHDPLYDELSNNATLVESADDAKFVVPSTGAYVSMNSAISLIHRYCSKLPSDVFTRLKPHFNVHSIVLSGETLYHAELVLPINSPLKQTITTDKCMPTKKQAMMAVALKGCQLLYEKGELNDNLLPTGKDTVANLLAELDDDEYLPFTGRVGSKRRRLYDRKLSKSFAGVFPELGDECRIYVIEMKLVNSIGEESNPKKRKIIDPYDTDTVFGILSKKALPKVPSFPVYQRQGEMLVTIREVNSNLVLTPELFELIKLLHVHIFEDILRIGHGDITFCPEESPIPLLLVPLRRRHQNSPSGSPFYQLDLRYLLQNIRDPPRPPEESIRQNFKFDEVLFLDSVVVPWYRIDEHNAYYYVAEILHEQGPASPFPDEKFSSFNEYFWHKYKLTIYDQAQRLIDVDHTSARLNLLLPRSSTGRNMKRSLDPSQRQILVPELVYIHPLPMTLWIMIPALPSIFYRLNALLLADELRIKVITEAFGLSPELPPEFEWEPLTYPTTAHNANQLQIKTLNQLKQIIKAENDGVSAPKQHTLVEMKQSSVKTGNFSATLNGDSRKGDESIEMEEPNLVVEEANFPIGVWNPSDAMEFLTPKPPPIRPNKSAESAANRDEEIAEMIATGGKNSLYAYHSDEDDDDEEKSECILFGYKQSNHSELAYLSQQNYIEINGALVTKGWNDDDETTQNIISIENQNLPLAMTGVHPDINVVALMKDLEANYSLMNPGGGEKMQAQQAPSQNEAFLRNKQIASRKLILDSMQEMDEEERLLSKKPTEELLEDKIDWKEFSPESLDEPNPCILEDKEKEVLGFTPSDTHSSISKDHSYQVIAPETHVTFSFENDFLERNCHGVPPTLLLQALTTSSAGDGINLERLETIGDSFLKLAVTNYLYHNHQEQHEGKLSFARSREVSNHHLFNIGCKRGIPYLMESSKFDPHINWLPPAYISISNFRSMNPPEPQENGSKSQENATTDEPPEATGWGELQEDENYKCENGIETITFSKAKRGDPQGPATDLPPIPYNYITQQYISEKAIADAIEALIGSHLISLGPGPTLKFMHWLGIKVLTEKPKTVFDPLLQFVDTREDPQMSKRILDDLYIKFNFANVEKSIGYVFGNKAYLVQAFTHASYYKNRVTGCYQRLEFLGDAVLDYLITRFLFEHQKRYSPGVLTDLRSALVNNTIFASLAVKYGLHKHFLSLCPGLHLMIEKFVNLCESNNLGHLANFDDEMFMITEDEIDEGHEEDVEVPKALGDIFESLAGAVYLDSGMNLDVVWRVFYFLMKECIGNCCQNPPQSPVRELFELKNCNARFTKLEKILETGKVRVYVDVKDDKGIVTRFVGMGRSYRIAKCTAAKRALQHLKKMEEPQILQQPKEDVQICVN